MITSGLLKEKGHASRLPLPPFFFKVTFHNPLGHFFFFFNSYLMRWISFPPIRSASGGSVIRSCSILFLTQSIIFSVLIIVSLSLPPSALAKVYPSASDPGAIQTFYMDPQTLWSNRQLWRQGHVGIQLKPAIDRLLRIADAAVADNNVYSVTRKSAGKLPPSGDIHDYYSLARYYWPPNSTTSTTATYVRIDGKPNPEIYSLSDHTYLQVMLNDVFNLGLAYFYTQNQTYAAKATTRIRDWFLTPTTRMNPNLNFANWIKGSNQTSVVMGNNTVGIKITNSGGLLGKTPKIIWGGGGVYFYSPYILPLIYFFRFIQNILVVGRYWLNQIFIFVYGQRLFRHDGLAHQLLYLASTLSPWRFRIHCPQ